jgi:5'-deoxynucleotidase YfbR-like HD superfamily hydrolase
MIDPTKSIRFASLVKRYHTWPVIREQNNAEHTLHVLRIYDRLFGLPSVRVVRAIMYHDIGEIGPGDAPFPSKRNNPDLKAAHDRVEREKRVELLGEDTDDITETAARYIKICDLLEMWEFGTEEVLRGNSLAEPIVIRTLQAAYSLCRTEDETRRVEDHIRRGIVE